MGEDKATKKRPRDILASLDAAFAPSTAKVASKYTTQAAQQTSAAVAQQAYQHKKKKKQNAPPTKHAQNKNDPTPRNAKGGVQNSSQVQRDGAAKEPLDPLYGRLDVETLQVGLKNCSLNTKVASMRKANTFQATLKQYIGGFAKEGAASAMADKLKNKVLQFDNPIRATDAVKKRRVEHAQAQSAKLLSARQRRKLGMHLLPANAVAYSDAEKLCEIWRRYARDVIFNDFVGDQSDERARTARLQAKLRYIDLSGCPIEVVQARNPLNVGTVGVIVADKSQIIQVCTLGRSTVITLPKQELRLRVSLDDDKCFVMDGRWLLNRRDSKD